MRYRGTRLWATVGIALLYYLTGRLGLLLVARSRAYPCTLNGPRRGGLRDAEHRRR